MKTRFKIKFRLGITAYYYVLFAITQICYLVYNIIDTSPDQPFVRTDVIWYFGEYISLIAFHARPLLYERKKLSKGDVFSLYSIIINYVVALFIGCFGNPYDWSDIWILKFFLILITMVFVFSRFTIDRRMIPIDEDEKDNITY